jgi:hypothetical protein
MSLVNTLKLLTSDALALERLVSLIIKRGMPGNAQPATGDYHR